MIILVLKQDKFCELLQKEALLLSQKVCKMECLKWLKRKHAKDLISTDEIKSLRSIENKKKAARAKTSNCLQPLHPQCAKTFGLLRDIFLRLQKSSSYLVIMPS